ncbi:uncharacterized protein BO97DRAFT_84090 [Aspergillus homomorphus CBS 101889]|uniref:Uncharacterized protein n=1 Tax=Aspergillus homomorphus (strain CBS 101889) TaxID=1450537 RepID=A0A395IA80_ASPHC|nr:hypothetical protein BO97DRAFT_84090 [Aspergillus homomorphus CBS 101889]RAL17122.1 hypothetical protein BO97DRAFT_84090 [Aspergillus homomorphus CBS 101889]
MACRHPWRNPLSAVTITIQPVPTAAYYSGNSSQAPLFCPPVTSQSTYETINDQGPRREEGALLPGLVADVCARQSVAASEEAPQPQQLLFPSPILDRLNLEHRDLQTSLVVRMVDPPTRSRE